MISLQIPPKYRSHGDWTFRPIRNHEKVNCGLLIHEKRKGLIVRNLYLAFKAPQKELEYLFTTLRHLMPFYVLEELETILKTFKVIL